MVWKFSCENLWEESFLGITLPCPREKERKKETTGRGRACLQLESLTSTSWDRSWIGWTSDLDGSLGFRSYRFTSVIPQRFLVFSGKLLRYDYSLQYKGMLEIPELALEGLACILWHHLCRDGNSNLRSSAAAPPSTRGELGAAPCWYNSAASGSVLTAVISGLWWRNTGNIWSPFSPFLCSNGDPYANHFCALTEMT